MKSDCMVPFEFPLVARPAHEFEFHKIGEKASKGNFSDAG